MEYSTTYSRTRRTRIFSVRFFEKTMILENSHCNIWNKGNNKKIIDSDNICRNIIIKSIVTKESFNQMKYIVGE